MAKAKSDKNKTAAELEADVRILQAELDSTVKDLQARIDAKRELAEAARVREEEQARLEFNERFVEASKDILAADCARDGKTNNPSGTGVGRNKFIDSVAEAVESTPGWGWTVPDRKNPFWVRRGQMECYEPMLEEYGLMDKWGADKNSMGPGGMLSASTKDLATPGRRFTQTQVRGLVRMSDEQFDNAMKVQAEQVLEEFAAWFWNDPAGGLAWYVAGQFGDVDEEKVARVLVLSEDKLSSVMPVRRDFQKNRILDMRYNADELAAAVRDYWCRTHGNVSLDVMREKVRETLDRFAEWFWNNGIVDYRVNEPITRVIAPKDARTYAENTNELMHMLGQASGRYEDEDWDIMDMLYTINDLAGYLRDCPSGPPGRPRRGYCSRGRASGWRRRGAG